MIKIFPSIIEANILNLEQEIKKLEPYCDGFHLDVMDGHFVENLTFGPDLINQTRKISSKQLFIHLMVDNPEQWVNLIKLNKDDIFAFHVEASKEPEKLIAEIHKKKWLASLAISPKTDIEKIYSFISSLDQILIMSVEPGKSGQKFIPETLKKIERLSNYKAKNSLKFVIAVDGGVNKNNIVDLINLGAQDFAIASAVFKAPNPINELENLYSLAQTVCS